jgi:hypothetical protein
MITRVIYQTSTRGEQACPSYSFVWKNFAPPRVKIFGWLLTKDRIHCRTNLVHKHKLQDEVCEICKGDDESADHIFSGCPLVRSFWEWISWDPNGIAKVTELWETRVPPRVHKKVAHPLILLCCWEIWRHRKDVVFKGLVPSVECLVGHCKEAMEAWSCRLPRRECSVSVHWRNSIVMSYLFSPKPTVKLCL